MKNNNIELKIENLKINAGLIFLCVFIVSFVVRKFYTVNWYFSLLILPLLYSIYIISKGLQLTYYNKTNLTSAIYKKYLKKLYISLLIYIIYGLLILTYIWF